MHLKDSSKLVNFCVAILILKMEENKQLFWHIMLFYLKNGKNTTEMQKKIHAGYEESAVTDRTRQSGLLSFMLQISGQCSTVG